MNILILNWRDPKHPLAGGAEQMVYEHAKYWLRKGNNVTWFCSGFENSKREEIIDGIKIVRRGNQYNFFLWPFFYYVLKKIEKPTVVIDCFHFIPYFSKFYMFKVPKIGLIQEVAGELWFDNLPFPFALVGYIIEKPILKFYKKIPFITGSKSAKDDLLNMGFRKDKVFVINHGINRKKVGKIKKEKDPTVIFLGRISKDKGIEDALTTLKLLARDIKNIKMWIVGKSESNVYEEKIKKIIKQYNLTKIVDWVGYVDEKKKFLLLSKAWILIHPSRREGWGLNVIEANSVKTPTVGYNVQGLKDSIINNKTGILVNPDAMSLADGVEEIIKNKSQYKTFQNNAFKWSENFDWEKAGKQSYKLMQKTVKNE